MILLNVIYAAVEDRQINNQYCISERGCWLMAK